MMGQLQRKILHAHEVEFRQFRRAKCCGYKSDEMVEGQAKDDESGQVQAEKPSLVSGGLLRMISPVSDTFT